jgi:hypothetical protein
MCRVIALTEFLLFPKLCKWHCLSLFVCIFFSSFGHVNLTISFWAVKLARKYIIIELNYSSSYIRDSSLFNV